MFNIPPSTSRLDRRSNLDHYMKTLRLQGDLESFKKKSIGTMYSSPEERTSVEFKISTPYMDEDMDKVRSMIQPFVKDSSYAVDFIATVGLENVLKSINPFIDGLAGYKNLTTEELLSLFKRFTQKAGLSGRPKKQKDIQMEIDAFKKAAAKVAAKETINRLSTQAILSRGRERMESLQDDQSKDKDEKDDGLEEKREFEKHTVELIEKAVQYWNAVKNDLGAVSELQKNRIINNLLVDQDFINLVGDERKNTAIFDEIKKVKGEKKKKTRGKGIEVTMLPFAVNPRVSYKKRDILKKGMIASGWR